MLKPIIVVDFTARVYQQQLLCCYFKHILGISHSADSAKRRQLSGEEKQWAPPLAAVQEDVFLNGSREENTRMIVTVWLPLKCHLFITDMSENNLMIIVMVSKWITEKRVSIVVLGWGIREEYNSFEILAKHLPALPLLSSFSLSLFLNTSLF